jgi:hypothetical protein
VHTVPAAASAALAGLLTGPPRRVEVAAATTSAVYLATGDPDLPAICLATPGAVRVPCAVVVPSLPPPADGTAGAGVLTVGPVTARVQRWWRPARPSRVSFPVRAPLRETVIAIGSLLGSGTGLTPYGDDVLAGLLVTLRALGDGRADALADEVDALAPARTTFVSAALLKHAGRGECIPELAAVLGAPSRASFAALLRVGHSSGSGLAQGMFTALWLAGR